MKSADIDIDFANRDDILDKIPHIAAMQLRGEIESKHVSGIYFQAIPTNPLNGGIATIPYDEAEQLGYTKFDFLNNSVYEGVKNEKHLIELRDREPPWEYLEEKLIANNLAHVNSDAKFALVKKMKPKSIEELAIVISLPLPGKKHLIGESWEDIRKEIWDPTKEYYFKKAHAIAFAVSIVVQLNLLIEKFDEKN